MSTYITTVDAAGTATFSPKVPTEQHAMPSPLGSMTLLYTTHGTPVSLADERDIDAYACDRPRGLGPGVPCPPDGSAAALVRFAPGACTPLRATPTLGLFLVLEGRMELTLAGGEARVLAPGDVGVVRAVGHSWRNVTEDGGWAKVVGFAQGVRVETE